MQPGALRMRHHGWADALHDVDPPTPTLVRTYERIFVGPAYLFQESMPCPTSLLEMATRQNKHPNDAHGVDLAGSPSKNYVAWISGPVVDADGLRYLLVEASMSAYQRSNPFDNDTHMAVCELTKILIRTSCGDRRYLETPGSDGLECFFSANGSVEFRLGPGRMPAELQSREEAGRELNTVEDGPTTEARGGYPYVRVTSESR